MGFLLHKQAKLHNFKKIMYMVVLLVWTFLIKEAQGLVPTEGMLFPRESETREVVSLDGIWNFVVSPIDEPLVGFTELWYKNARTELKGVDVHLMPVPSSYNDITQNPEIRDHLGLVWYDRTFFVPRLWANHSRVCLRFSSVSYAAKVYINGELVLSHEIGHLPFQAEISSFLDFGKINRITVACDNTLLQDTVPQGSVREEITDEGEKLFQSYTFDFFNYAGIDRPVTLYTTPWTYIDDITIYTDINGTTGIVHYNVTYINKENVTCVVILLDKKGNKFVGEDNDGEGVFNVPSAKFWWPYLMDPDPGYLYTLQVELRSTAGELIDVYRQPLGIRTITWTNTSMFINDRPIYFHGFGRHEDADIRGKGLDLPTIIKDHNLIKWVGGNSYRTTHYPYADEIMDLADQLGIMIINECSSVNTEPSLDENGILRFFRAYSYQLLEKHKDSLTELIKRDKNRPSVVMWSIANEPRSQLLASDDYFEEIVQHVKSLDTSRPVTIALDVNVEHDLAGKHLDIISFNRYNAWYHNPGYLDMITNRVIEEATAWHFKHNKPVLMSEYGADTMEGLHIQPPYIWSEEYQVKLMSKHFKAFDRLRAEGWFIGEFIWNFADFKTAQTYIRVGGNKKGIFTRNRQPKASAHHLRRRYFLLSKELYNATIPNDLYDYVASDSSFHNEL